MILKHWQHPTTVDFKWDGEESMVFGNARMRTLNTLDYNLRGTCYLLEGSGLCVSLAGEVINPLFQNSGLCNHWLKAKLVGTKTNLAARTVHTTTVSELHLTWPTSQTTQSFRDITADQAIEIMEGTDSFQPQPWVGSKSR